MLERLTAALADRYRIVREVGAGGMATVFLAEDLKHGREVALKVLRPELAATMGPERFFREIQVAARLQHPHILPLHDSGEADGFLFFVMPFVAGESLRDRLTRLGELPVSDVVRIASQVADAISYAHSQGVVHRDIKPDNVMLSGRHALVADFGVAKAVSEAAGANSVTTAGVALGTPTYMAPEQATADPHLDHRVDIYAIGVMLYEMLTGRPPFEGLAPAQMLVAHVTETPQPVRVRREACPPELEAVVMRCLAKRPADRFQSADDVLHALEPLSASSGGITPTQTRPATAVEAATASPRGNSRLVLGVSAVAIVAALAAWGFTRGDAPVPEIALSSLERVKVTSSGWARSGALAPDGNRAAFFERRCDGAGACALDLRVQDIGGAGSSVLVAGLAFADGVDWSPDSRWIAFTGTYRDRFGAYVIPSLGGTPRLLGCCAASFTGGGDTLLLGGPAVGDVERPVLQWGTASSGTMHRRVELGDDLKRASAARQVRHDRLIVSRFLEQGTTAWVLDLEGRIIDTLPVANIVTGLTLPAATSTGVWVATAPENASRQVQLSHFRWDSKGRLDPRPTAIVRNVPISAGISITPSGLLMGGEGSTEYSVWTAERRSAADAAPRLRMVAQSTSMVSASVTPDGSQLLIARRRPNAPRTMEFSLMPFAGGPERSVAVLERVLDWDFFPDSRRLLVLHDADITARRVIVDVTSGAVSPVGDANADDRLLKTLPGGGYVFAPSKAVTSIAVRDVPGRADTLFAVRGDPGVPIVLAPAPDGRRIAIAAFLSTLDSVSVATMDLVTGEQVNLIAIRGEGSTEMHWLPDGNIVVQVWETELTPAWWLVPSRGGAARRLGLQPRADGNFRWAADGLRGVYREAVRRSDIEVWRALPVDGVP